MTKPDNQYSRQSNVTTRLLKRKKKQTPEVVALAESLRQYRRKTKKSFDWIARQIGGINKATLWRLCKEQHTPSELTIYKLEDFLKEHRDAA